MKVSTVERLYADAEGSFAHWELVKDIVDEFIDLMLNYRQSGHPGRLPLQGSPARCDAALRGDALGYPATVAALRGPPGAFGRAYGAGRLRDACRPQRNAAHPRRS